MASRENRAAYDPKTLHVKRRKVQHILRATLGSHILSVFHAIQIAVTNSKLRIMGDGKEPLLSYINANEGAKAFHVAPLWVRIHFTSMFPILALQSKQELSKFMDIVRQQKPKTFLELGTCYGGTLLMLSKVAADDATMISLDIDHSAWRMKLFRSFARAKQTIIPLKADSHDHRTVHRITQLLNGEKLDLLFIDGDHSYQGVKKDYLMYSKLVRRGGIVAFHDVHPRFPLKICGVWKLWKEIKDDYLHIKILGDDRPGDPLGIGILRM